MRVRTGLWVAALCAAMGAAAYAQGVPEVKLPASPAGQAAVQIAGTWEKTPQGGQRYANGKWIVVNYGRPLLRGRPNIFGAGADYGKQVKDDSPVWRAGANDTTRLTTQVPLSIGGKTVQPGTYNVFVDLKPGAWEIILTTQPVQAKYDPNDKVNLYGAYNYDAKFDVLRAPMKVASTPESVEQFTIGFVNATADGATLYMEWDKTRAMVDLKVAK